MIDNFQESCYLNQELVPFPPNNASSNLLVFVFLVMERLKKVWTSLNGEKFHHATEIFFFNNFRQLMKELEYLLSMS